MAALALATAVLALGACGDDQSSSEASLPPRPKLTIPNQSVAPARNRSRGETASTGATSTATGDSSAGTGTQTGGAGTGTDTGGAGTGTGTQGDTQTTPPQNTGGAAPGQ